MQVISHFAKNSMRKSYRTSIPLSVVIDKRTYHALDWSLTGIALKNPDIGIKPGETLKAALVLQMKEATVSIPVTFRLEYSEAERYGFSFLDLSDTNKTVLRRFIELAIEGKINNTDDIIAIYEEPQVATPVQSPVTLHEEDAKVLKASFMRASFKYLLFTAAVFALLGGLLFFNLRYSYEGSGIVAGNDLKIYSSVNAIVEKLYVKEGDTINKGTPLAELDSSEVTYKLALLEAEKKKKIAKFEQEKLYFQKSLPDNKRVISLLKQKVARTKAALRSARIQYAEHLITMRTLSDLENSYLDAKMKLENTKMQKEIMQKRMHVKAPETLQTDDIDVKLEYLKRKLTYYRITAPLDAKVYEIYVSEGQEATRSNPIMLLWTKETPYIVADVPVKYLSDISLGTDVDIVDTLENRTFKGKVFKITNPDESVVEDTFRLFIKPDKSENKLKPHQRLQVLFKRDF